MPPSLQRIDHIHVHVADRRAAETWYQSVLGFTRIKELEFWAVDGGPLPLTDASGQIHLALFERPAESRHATIAFGVTAEEFLAWRDHLQGVPGLAVELEDHAVSWSLYFQDPDRNPYELTCYEHASLLGILRGKEGSPMRNEEEMMAYALEMEPQLLPFAPALLADLDELGSEAELIVEVLQSLQLPPSTRVVDLGCGKGAVALEIAQELGWHVLGVDLFAPFIEHCRTRAEMAGVTHLCRFVCGDILQLARNIEPCDIVHIGALGDTLGSYEETVRVVRQYVRPGGYIVISDGYLKDGCEGSFAGFENYTTHDETVRRLTSHGDVLLKEFAEPAEAADAEDEESDLILQRATLLAQQHPHLAEALLAFAASQRSEVEFLRQNFVSTVWLLQRT